MTPQDFKITYFERSDYTDPHNNVWCNVLFEGHQNEQIRMVVKDPNAYSVGQIVYGHIDEKTSQAGKPYLRFYRDKKPDDFTQSDSGKSSHKDNSDGQRQGMCFNNAAAYLNANVLPNKMLSPNEWAKAVYSYALALYNKGDLIGGAQSGGMDITVSPTVPNEKQNLPSAPLAKRDWDKLGQETSDEDAQQLYASIAQGEEINLDEIPY